MSRSVEYALMPRRGPVLYGAIGGLCALAGVVVFGVAATLPSQRDVAVLGAAAGIPMLVRRDRPVIESLVRPASARHLRSVFESLGYRLDAVRAGDASVPRVYVTALPEDLGKVSPARERKALFLQSVLPLVLIANEELRGLRGRIRSLGEKIGRGGLSQEDRAWLEWVSRRYMLAGADDLETLLRRVDEVPVSLALAQSIEESGWGTSRFARLGNALFGQRTWSTAAMGLVPAARADRQTFRVRSYMSLLGAVRSYMHNLNTHQAYAPLRAARARARAEGQPLDGYTLAGMLLSYSERGAAYVEQLRGLMRVNELVALERARLSAAGAARRDGPPGDG